MLHGTQKSETQSVSVCYYVTKLLTQTELKVPGCLGLSPRAHIKVPPAPNKRKTETTHHHNPGPTTTTRRSSSSSRLPFFLFIVTYFKGKLFGTFQLLDFIITYCSPSTHFSVICKHDHLQALTSIRPQDNHPALHSNNFVKLYIKRFCYEFTLHIKNGITLNFCDQILTNDTFT